MYKTFGITNLSFFTIEEIISTDKGFLTIDNSSYFYKRCNHDLSYRELIAYEFAQYLGIPSIYYELCLIPNKIGELDLGVISKDYRKDKFIYVLAQDIIKDYNHVFLKQEWYENKRKNNYAYHNIENIYSSLKYRYHFMENGNEISNKILKEIIKNLFLFDIFTQNADRHFNNWQVEENLETNEIKLNSNYDNEDIFLKNYNIPQLGYSITNKNSGDWYDVLREFLTSTNNEYLPLVEEMFNKLTPENLITLIELTERKHQILIPLETKKDIVEKYNNHYQQLKFILEDFKKNSKKIILIP